MTMMRMSLGSSGIAMIASFWFLDEYLVLKIARGL